MRVVFIISFCISSLISNCQTNNSKNRYYLGLKIHQAPYVYGYDYAIIPNNFFTDWALQPSFRFEHPVKLFSKNNNFLLTLQTGLGYVSTADSILQSPSLKTKRPKSAYYLPVYLGLHTTNKFSIGVDAFYSKGFHGVDIWGIKPLALEYNIHRARVGASLEMYSQIKGPDHSSFIMSFEFMWRISK